jgi:hypothetical protein
LEYGGENLIKGFGDIRSNSSFTTTAFKFAIHKRPHKHFRVARFGGNKGHMRRLILTNSAKFFKSKNLKEKKPKRAII